MVCCYCGCLESILKMNEFNYCSLMCLVSYIVRFDDPNYNSTSRVLKNLNDDALEMLLLPV